MKSADEIANAEKGNLWKGIGLALLCQFAYLFFVFELRDPEVQVLGRMLFALIQFAYLFPIAIFYHKRKEELTSKGIIVVGAVSLLAAAVWFGYAAAHGALPSINGS